MKKPKKYFAWIVTFFVLIVVASGTIFYKIIVGNSGTNIFSVLFGWQWIYLAIASLVILFVSLVRKSKVLCMTALLMLASLAIVLVPARIVESSRMYITGEGGPSGPHFSCLGWDKSTMSGAYGNDFGLCTVMSMPSYNKFLIDRSYDADQSDNSPTYYVMLLVNEAIVAGGVGLAYRTVMRRENSDHR